MEHEKKETVPKKGGLQTCNSRTNSSASSMLHGTLEHGSQHALHSTGPQAPKQHPLKPQHRRKLNEQ